MFQTLFFLILSSLCFANSFYLDKNSINIDAWFKGDTIQLYGNKDTPGKVIIVLKGQKTTYIIQKKEKYFGIWAKGKKINFQNIYRYYQLSSETCLNKLYIANLLRPFEIGIENISSYFNSVEDTLNTFEHKNFLLQNKIKNNLFTEECNKKIIVSNNLIHTSFNIPENIPEGKYIVSIYVIMGNKIQSINNIPFEIKQVGVLHFIKHSAVHNKVLYFMLSIGSSIGIALLGYIILSNKFLQILKLVVQRKSKKSVSTPSLDIETHKRKRGRPKKSPENTIL